MTTKQWTANACRFFRIAALFLASSVAFAQPVVQNPLKIPFGLFFLTDAQKLQAEPAAPKCVSGQKIEGTFGGTMGATAETKWIIITDHFNPAANGIYKIESKTIGHKSLRFSAVCP